MEDEYTLECPHETHLSPNEGELLPEFILRKVREHLEAGKTTWIIDAATDEKQDFSEFEEMTRRVAVNMYNKGMRKGDTVIYMTSHFVKLASFFVGVWRANGIVRSTYPEDDGDTLAMRVQESRAGWILCDENLADLCIEVAERMYWDVEVIVVGDHSGCIPFDYIFNEVGDEEPPMLELSEDDPALVLCTSGTTGRSKGAVHTHRTVLNLIMSSLLVPFPEQQPSLLVTKCTHISGFLFPFTFVCGGKTAIVMCRVTKTAIYQAVHDYKPGLIWGFPTYLLALVVDPAAAKYDFSSLEVAVTGGAQVTPQMEKAMTNLPNLKALVNFYGLTEVLPVTTELNYDDSEHIKLPDVPPFSVGKVCPGVKVQIRDPDTGAVLGPNQKGEICCRSPAMFSHYINNQEATTNTFIEDWFRTGDLGYYDENQFVFLVDRMKEIFKYWNNHISPTEVEDIINQHPAVNEVCVIGVEDPEGGGFVPRAFVTLKDDGCTPEEIIRFSNDRLPNYKHLRGGLFAVSDLPKGKTGKIQRNLVSQMTLPELGAIVEEEAEQNNNDGVTVETEEAEAMAAETEEPPAESRGGDEASGGEPVGDDASEHNEGGVEHVGQVDEDAPSDVEQVTDDAAKESTTQDDENEEANDADAEEDEADDTLKEDDPVGGDQEETPGDNEGTSGDNEEVLGDNEGAPGDNEGAPGDNEGAPGDNEGAPGGIEGTEENLPADEATETTDPPPTEEETEGNGDEDQKKEKDEEGGDGSCEALRDEAVPPAEE